MIEQSAALVWSTFPNRDSAHQVAAALLGERLIACANIIPGLESIYEWAGKIESSTEVAVLFKSHAKALQPLVTRLGELHPYEIPAIIGWQCDATHPETLSWLGETVAPGA